MKVRTGFVSNSSSSSFVTVITEKGYDQAYSELCKEFQEVLDKVMTVERLGGAKVYLFQEHCDMGGGSYWMEENLDFELPPKDEKDREYEEDEKWRVEEIFDQLCAKVPKGESITSSQDW